MIVERIHGQQDFGFSEDRDGVHVIHQILFQTAIHTFQPEVGNLRRKTAVDKSRTINDGYHVLLQQPLAVNAFRAECLAQCEKAFWEGVVKAPPQVQLTPADTALPCT